MLQLSENAAAALETIRASEGIPETHDTRLTAERGPTGDLAVRLEFVENALPEDGLAEQGGTQVYVDPLIVDALSESVMDVREGDDGLTFVFRPQAG